MKTAVDTVRALPNAPWPAKEMEIPSHIGTFNVKTVENGLEWMWRPTASSVSVGPFLMENTVIGPQAFGDFAWKLAELRPDLKSECKKINDYLYVAYGF